MAKVERVQRYQPNDEHKRKGGGGGSIVPRSHVGGSESTASFGTAGTNGGFRDPGASGIISCVGLPGTGKSYLAAWIACQYHSRIIAIDTVHQYNTPPINNPLPGFVTVSDIPALVEFLRVHRHGPFRVNYQPQFRMSGKLGKRGATAGKLAEFDAVLRLALEVRNVCVLVDEIWNYCSPGWMPDSLEFISRAWRHRQITLIYTSQRPQLVCADLRENTTQWRVFRTSGALALAALEGKVPDAAMSAIPRLPDRWHIQCNEYEEFRVLKPSQSKLRGKN